MFPRRYIFQTIIFDVRFLGCSFVVKKVQQSKKRWKSELRKGVTQATPPPPKESIRYSYLFFWGGGGGGKRKHELFKNSNSSENQLYKRFKNKKWCFFGEKKLTPEMPENLNFSRCWHQKKLMLLPQLGATNTNIEKTLNAWGNQF